MKKWIQATAALSAALLSAGVLTACGSSSDNAAGSVTFYTDMDPQEAQPLIDAFKEQTGIDVELFTGGSAAVLAKWDSEEAGNVHNADVVSLSGAAAYDKIATSGYNAAIPDSVDFFEGDRPDNAFDPERMWFSTTATVVGIAYNPNNVSEADAPATWEDLVDPKWKGQITIAAPTLSTAQATYYQMFNDPELGDPYLTALSGQEPVTTQKSGDTVSALVTGDTTVAIANDNAVWAQKSTGAPLAIVYPQEGQPVLMNYTMLAKNAPNPDGAAKLLAFLATPEAGAIYAQTGAYSALTSIAPEGDGRPSLGDLVAWPLVPAELVAAQPEMVPFLNGLFGD